MRKTLVPSQTPEKEFRPPKSRGDIEDFEAFDVTKFDGLDKPELRRALLEKLILKNPDKQISIQHLCRELENYLSLRAFSITPRIIAEDLNKHLARPGTLKGFRIFVSGLRESTQDKTIAIAELQDLKGASASGGEKSKLQLPADPKKKQAALKEGETVCEAVAIEVIERRAGHAPEAKLALGEALWHHLFGLNLPQLEGESIATGTLHGNIDSHHNVALARKIATLRSKTTLNIAVDAGSTTRSVMEVLLRVKHIPFRLEGAAKTKGPAGVNLVRPAIVTNSPVVASLVRHSIHAHNLSLRVIGGDVRVDRASLCGALSEIFLGCARLNAHCALVGVTGVNSRGPAIAFTCDDILEARMKTALLELSTGLRVLVFDRRKLADQDGTHVFTTIDSNLVDLIVTNEADKNDSTAVELERNLCAQGEEFGVGVMLVKKAL